MRKIERTGQFKQDYKRELKARHRATLETTFVDVLMGLINNQPLPEKHRDHALTGHCRIAIVREAALVRGGSRQRLTPPNLYPEPVSFADIAVCRFQSAPRRVHPAPESM